MEVYFDELGEYYGPVGVMTDDLIGTQFPRSVPTSIDDFGYTLNSVEYYAPGLEALEAKKILSV